MKTLFKQINNNRGVTLLELLIASLIMGMITISMVKIYNIAYRAFAKITAEVKSAQDAMFLFDEINSKMRMAIRPGWEEQGALGSYPDEPLDPYLQFFNTTGNLNFNSTNDYNDAAVSNNNYNGGVGMTLTTYRSNKATADQSQVYGVFEGDDLGVWSRYVFSSKFRPASLSAPLFNLDWVNHGDGGAISTSLYGLMFETYSNVDYITPTNNVFLSAAGQVLDTQTEFDNLKGIKTVVFLERLSEQNGVLTKVISPFFSFTSFRYKDWTP